MTAIPSATVAQALTWIFSYQIADPENPALELSAVKELYSFDRVQYLAYQITRHSQTGSIYIRGIVRLLAPLSSANLQAYCPLGHFKPLRCIFKPSVVAHKLRLTDRVGELFEFGSVALKRFLPPSGACTGLCKSCCTSNKKLKILFYLTCATISHLTYFFCS